MPNKVTPKPELVEIGRTASYTQFGCFLAELANIGGMCIKCWHNFPLYAPPAPPAAPEATPSPPNLERLRGRRGGGAPRTRRPKRGRAGGPWRRSRRSSKTTSVPTPGGRGGTPRLLVFGNCGTRALRRVMSEARHYRRSGRRPTPPGPHCASHHAHHLTETDRQATPSDAN